MAGEAITRAKHAFWNTLGYPEEDEHDLRKMEEGRRTDDDDDDNDDKKDKRNPEDTQRSAKSGKVNKSGSETRAIRYKDKKKATSDSIKGQDDDDSIHDSPVKKIDSKPLIKEEKSDTESEDDTDANSTDEGEQTNQQKHEDTSKKKKKEKPTGKAKLRVDSVSDDENDDESNDEQEQANVDKQKTADGATARQKRNDKSNVSNDDENNSSKKEAQKTDKNKKQKKSNQKDDKEVEKNPKLKDKKEKGKEKEKDKKNSESNPSISSLAEEYNEHTLPVEKLCKRYDSSGIDARKPSRSKGLSTKDAEAGLEEHGQNKLTPAKEISMAALFFKQFLNPFWILLMIAATLSLVAYLLDRSQPNNLYCAIVIYVMVFVMCCVSFFEERKSRKVISGFTNMVPQKCTIIRDGKEAEINAEELTIGDLVWIRSGSKVPADIRLLSANGLKLETSAITGESEPIDYTAEEAADNVSAFDAHNIAFNSSCCVDGEGLGVVVRIGDETIIGQIASLTSHQRAQETTLEKQIKKFIRFVMILSIVTAVVVFAVGLGVNRGKHALNMFINGFLIIIIANVPQGLPATVTSQLTLIARRMAKHNVFMKQLNVMDAFGATTVIASDKTGTLTKNDMTVTDLWFSKAHSSELPKIKKRILEARIHAKSEKVNDLVELLEDPLPMLITAMAVCSKARIEQVPDDEPVQGPKLGSTWRKLTGKAAEKEEKDLEKGKCADQTQNKKEAKKTAKDLESKISEENEDKKSQSSSSTSKQSSSSSSSETEAEEQGASASNRKEGTHHKTGSTIKEKLHLKKKRDPADSKKKESTDEPTKRSQNVEESTSSSSESEQEKANEEEDDSSSKPGSKTTTSKDKLADSKSSLTDSSDEEPSLSNDDAEKKNDEEQDTKRKNAKHTKIGDKLKTKLSSHHDDQKRKDKDSKALKGSEKESDESDSAISDKAEGMNKSSSKQERNSDKQRHSSNKEKLTDDSGEESNSTSSSSESDEPTTSEKQTRNTRDKPKKDNSGSKADKSKSDNKSRSRKALGSNEDSEVSLSKIHNNPHHTLSMRDRGDNDRIVLRGAPSEVALLRFVENITSSDKLRKKYNILFEIPFNSQRKWHLIIVKSEEKKNSKFLVIMTGAPEVLVKKCNRWASEKGDEEMNKHFKDEFEDAYLHYGKQGRRVIGFCYTEFKATDSTKFSEKKKNFPQDKMCFLGMVAIMDPPRDDVAKAIDKCRDAGIKVFMVTGDHPVTAQAIARQIGLIGTRAHIKPGKIAHSVTLPEKDDPSAYAIIHGDDVKKLKKEQWDDLIKKRNVVFARTTPEMKLRIVEECQKRGEIVCVTGDGVNDAPALKKADIGVAMGGIGSDVAKQAADVVLMDDNFASIVSAIQEGRILFDNLKKTVTYTLAHLTPELFTVIMTIALGFPPLMTSLQILSIDLCTEMGPAISLAYEPAERDVMKKPPRKREQRLVGKAMLLYAYGFAGVSISTAAFLSYCWQFWKHGIAITDIAFTANDHWKLNATKFCSSDNCFDDKQQVFIASQATACFYITLIMCQFFHIWMCKTRRSSFFYHIRKTHSLNMITLFAVIIEISLMLLFVYVPGVQVIMGAEDPDSMAAWIPCLGTGLFLWVFNEVRKVLIRHYPHSKCVKVFKW